MPTRTRIATFVVALAATAIGFLTPAASVGEPDAGAGQTAGVHSR
jgi:hypothetical protein